MTIEDINKEMAEGMRDMSGVFSRNKWKTPGSKRPDITGKMMLNGIVWEISGWDNSKSPDDPFYAFAIQEPYKIRQMREAGQMSDSQKSDAPQEVKAPPAKEESDGVDPDELPF